MIINIPKDEKNVYKTNLVLVLIISKSTKKLNTKYLVAVILIFLFRLSY